MAIDLSEINFKPKAGRPKLPPGKKKDSYIRFLMRAEEREMIEEMAEAHGKNMSELLRDMIRTCYSVDKKKGLLKSAPRSQSTDRTSEGSAAE